MLTLVAAIGIFVGKSPFQASKPAAPPSIQLQEKAYPLSAPMEVTGENAVLDGHGATLAGKGAGVGLHIGASGHVTVKNLKIVGFATGLLAQGSPDLTLVNVAVANSATGIRLEKVSGGLLQGVQSHNCGIGVELLGCSKLIFEKSDLSQDDQIGLKLSATLSCIIRDNKIAAVGENSKSNAGTEGVGMTIENGSDHNQILRNIVIRCRSRGISMTSVGNQPSTDNTFQGNDVSWTIGGAGILIDSEAKNKILDNTAAYSRIGFLFTKTSETTVHGNLFVGDAECGLRDENGSKNSYDTNVFVQENGGPVAVDLKGTDGSPSDISLFQNVFMGFDKPLKIENASPVTLQSNSFPWVKSTELSDIAVVAGKKPLALDSQNEKPQGIEFVSSVGFFARIPTIYDRLGGVSVSTTHEGELEIVVEGSLTGAFQGEEEVLARFKGLLPVELTFPPRFEMQVRVRQVTTKPVFASFLALLGDNSMAHDRPADDSGDTLFTPGQAVDGDITSPDHAWRPPKGKAGEWWEVDLKSDRTISAFSVTPNPASPNDFWTKFHIAVSSSGLFKGEETTVVTEANWPLKPGPLRIYRIPPTVGRYVRIYGDQDQQGVQLQQFGVYGIKQ